MRNAAERARTRSLSVPFLWGGSTSAFQFEGGGHEGGKGPSIYDEREKKTGVRYSVASDFYHHWREDIALMAEMRFSAFRMSIAWSRLFPDGEGELNKEGVAFYRDVFGELRAHGIEPVVTLFHWDMPSALVERYDGFAGRGTVDAFERYCRTCFEEFGDLVTYWLTLNENNLGLMIPPMYSKRKRSSGDSDYAQYQWTSYHHTLVCHALAVKACHEIIPDAKIGCMLASAYAYPLSPDPRDVRAAQKHNQRVNWDELDVLTGGWYNQRMLLAMEREGIDSAVFEDARPLFEHPATRMDFISFSYYFTVCMRDGENKRNADAKTVQMLYAAYENPCLEKSSFGWTIDPEGLRIFANELYDRYKLPIMVVENGLGVKDDVLEDDGSVHDPYRISYLRAHIDALNKARHEDGVPVLGYLPWGCIDLYSASGDYTKRYGFVYVDFDRDLTRYRKDSFYWYKQVIASDGANLSWDEEDAAASC